MRCAGGKSRQTTNSNPRRATVAASFMFILALGSCQTVANTWHALDVCDQQAMQAYPPILREQEYQGSEPVEVFDGTETCTTTLEYDKLVEKCRKGTKIDYRPITRVRTIDLNESNRSEYSSRCVPNYCLKTYGSANCSPPKAIGELVPQTLMPGSCGLFLWSQTSPTRFIFFSEASTDKALMNIGGVESPLELISESGDVFGQFMTQMTYRSPAGDVGLSFKSGEILDGGQRIKDGRLSLIRETGQEESTIPVVGLRACQP